MKVLIIDNYDSFVYNIVYLLKNFEVETHVVRNDKINIDKIASFDKILLSPGPGLPDESGKLVEVIEKYYKKKPILGICLGHQAIGEFLGGRLVNLSYPKQGILTKVHTQQSKGSVFEKTPKTFQVTLYCSWVIEKNSLPEDILITAMDENNLIMGIKHKKYPIEGIQFHPEAYLTEGGKLFIQNWLYQ